MTEQLPPSHEKSAVSTRAAIWLGVIALVAAIAWFGLDQKPDPEPTVVVKKEPEPVMETPPEPVITRVDPKPEPKTKPQATPKKPVKQQASSAPQKQAPTFDGFIIEGDLSTGGEPWAAESIIIRILWIKNPQEQYRLGREIARLRPDSSGLHYRLHLKPLGPELTNWNNGVEGNIGRVIAYLDMERDGRLSIHKDRIIAVSKEMVRYRTGRFDTELLNEIQQQNIQKEGKGYVVIHEVQVDGKSDWQVAHRKSPAPVHLSAMETHLPKFYTTLIKLQVK